MIGANPTIGEVGTMEQVPEFRLEVVCDASKLPAVLAALRQSHPYEEPPIEVYKLEDITQF
jgi:hypothetical protein